MEQELGHIKDVRAFFSPMLLSGCKHFDARSVMRLYGTVHQASTNLQPYTMPCNLSHIAVAPRTVNPV